MKKIREYLKIIFYPLLLIITEISLVFLFTVIFNLNTNLEIGTELYQEKLNIFISNYKLLIVIISFLLLFSFLSKKVKVSLKHLKINNLVLYVLIGICMALSYNLLLCGLNKIVYFTNLYDLTNRNIIVVLLTTGIFGPILEELIFRGIVYEKLKLLHKRTTAIIITGILFGLFHGNIIQFIYAFLLNFILIKSYEKENNVLTPIIIHVCLNSITVLLINFIIKINLFLTTILFFVFLIVLIILLKILYKENNNGYDNNVNEC